MAGPDRRVEQPDFGRRHPVRARHLADPRRAVPGRRAATQTKALVAFALFVTAIIFGVATISNNNLQDLKTGQLVEATPWRQQVALVLGVVFGALVIPPILDLMNTAFTFQGAPGAKATALAAPQAAIISTIAQGVLGGNLDWGLIRAGRDHRRGRGDRRRSAEARLGQAAAPAAAGDRHGHLSADGSRPADPVRRGARLVLQSLGDAVDEARPSPSAWAC